MQESGPHFSPVCVAFIIAWKKCSGLCAPENAGCPFMTKNGTPFTPAILAASASPTPPPANSPPRWNSFPHRTSRSSSKIFVGSQLVASDGIQRIHWGRVSGFWKTHKVPDPESRDATPQFNRPLARGIASHHRNAECRAQTRDLRNKFCAWKGICQAGLRSRSGIGQSPDPIEVHPIRGGRVGEGHWIDVGGVAPNGGPIGQRRAAFHCVTQADIGRVGKSELSAEPLHCAEHDRHRVAGLRRECHVIAIATDVADAKRHSIQGGDCPFGSQECVCDHTWRCLLDDGVDLAWLRIKTGRRKKTAAAQSHVARCNESAVFADTRTLD